MKLILPKALLIAYTLLVCTLPMRATHIVGGEITAEYLGTVGGFWEYKVTVWIYRDCGPTSTAPFDDPMGLTIFTSDYNLFNVEMINFPPTGALRLPVIVNNPCLVAPPNICTELGVYEEIIRLPIDTGGYILTYQRCCRNAGIVNLDRPGDAGSTYSISIPGTNYIGSSPNSSPKFINYPPLVLCLDDNFDFDHSATDPDGDSLVYFFCTPYHGATRSMPQPVPSSPPPYPNVNWATGFGISNQITGSPAFVIDSFTGRITGTPSAIGKYVVGICVQEYRGGVLLSENKRDFQFNITTCDPNSVAAASTQESFCDGLTVTFRNSSANAISYFWDFGDPTTAGDTSYQFEPTYTFADTGKYTITLIANPGYSCADTVYTEYAVYKTLEPKFDRPEGQCFDEHNFNFTAAGLFQQYAQFVWEFGNSAVTNNSFSKNPENVRFKQPGVFPVRLIVRENGCEEDYIDTVFLYPNPKSRFDVDERSLCIPAVVQFTNNSEAWSDMTFLWEFGDGSFSTDPNPKHVYPKPGVYDIRLTTATAEVCTSAVTLLRKDYIRANAIPVAALGADRLVTSIQDPVITFNDISKGSRLCKLYPGDGLGPVSCDEVHYYQKPGRYKVKQIVYSLYECSDTNYLDIFIKPEVALFIPNTFTPNIDTKNEVFRAYGDEVLEYDFRIYDKWGQLVYYTQTLERGWDGTRNGIDSPSDVYVYVIRVTDILEEQHEFRGTVTLLR